MSRFAYRVFAISEFDPIDRIIEFAENVASIRAAMETATIEKPIYYIGWEQEDLEVAMIRMARELRELRKARA